ncbi:MAG: ISAs1 family transposase [Mycobacterium sp.]|nr:ISAs1 family transposase [Mycobacterium sp.]
MPVSHVQAGVLSLLEMLAGISDPRDPRGVRHRSVAVLGIAVVATLAGAANYRELGSVAADLPQRMLRLLGARCDSDRQRFVAPSAATLRRVLIALDADELDAAVGVWLREHATCDERGWAIALDGKDLHGSWDAGGRLVLFSAMTHRAAGQAAVVLGQIRVPEGTTETTQVRTLLEEMDIAGALVTADAAHTCVETARYLVEDKKADYLLTIKGNRSSLHAAAIAACRKLITTGPGHVAEERGHGRINRWTTWAGGIGEGIGLRTRPGWRSSAATWPTWPDSHSARTLRSWSPAGLTWPRPRSLAIPGGTGASRTSRTDPATPSGTKTTSRPTSAMAPASWPPFATWPSACLPSTRSPRSRRRCRRSAASPHEPSR